MDISSSIISDYEQFGKWTDTLLGLSETTWHSPIQEGKASIAEIIAHLRNWDLHLIHVIIPAIRKGEDMVFPNFDSYNSEAYHYANSGVSKDQLLQEFKRDRMELIRILKSMKSNELLLEVKANGVTHCPNTGTPYSLLYIIQEFNEHDEHHKKQMSSLHIRNLAAVTEKLEQSGISYSLGGSGLMLSLGLTNAVGDWDVMVEASKDRVLHALQRDQIEERRSGDYPFGTKYKLVIQGHGPQVEIIGGLSIYTNKGLCKLPSIPSSIWNGIQVGSPEVWYAAYALMNRMEKAAVLLAYLKKAGANKEILNNLMNEPLPDEIMGEIRSLIET